MRKVYVGIVFILIVYSLLNMDDSDAPESSNNKKRKIDSNNENITVEVEPFLYFSDESVDNEVCKQFGFL